MEQVINQILEKLLSERDKTSRLELQLSDHRFTISQVASLLDADFNSLEQDASVYVKKHEELRAKYDSVLSSYSSIDLPSVESGLTRALSIVGLKKSGSLASDLENLVRFLETSRFQSTKIL